MALKIGEQAPDFTLANSNGKPFSLSTDLKDKPCIIFFYPKDFTPGCTKEACAFRDNFSLFEQLDIQVIGISTDTVESHLKFKQEFNLPYELLADTSGEVSKKYKALVPFINISKRITYLLDAHHKIRAVYQELFGYESHIKAMIRSMNEESKTIK
jgi:thioredoxin-dependent peroxiredoxin